MTEEELKKQTAEVTEAKTGEPVEEEKPKKTSLIDEAKQIRDDNRRLLETLQEERRKMEEIFAKGIVEGKAMAGTPEKSDEEKAAEEAADIIKRFR